MAGHISKRGPNTWRVRISFGADGDGKRLNFNQTVHGSKKDAEKVLTAKLREKDLGTFVQPSAVSLDAFHDRWLKESAKPRLAESTYENYEWMLERYVRDELGKRQLSDVKAASVSALYSGITASGLSPRTVRYVHAILNSAFAQAIRWHLLSVNPCQGADLPRKTHTEMKSFSPDQARAFLAACRRTHDCGTCSKCQQMKSCRAGERCDACRMRVNRGSKKQECQKRCLNVVNRYGLVFAFALESGMRPEEYLALKWADLDFERKRVTVQRTLIRKRSTRGWYFDKPKTAKSRRSIPMSAEMFADLKAHRTAQLRQIMQLGAEYERNDLVFANEFGGPLDLKNIRARSFARILEAAKLGHYETVDDRKVFIPGFRVYDLRHSMATLMLANGENAKVVSERLGHASIVLTLDVYSHVLPDMQTDATARLGKMLYG